MTILLIKVLCAAYKETSLIGTYDSVKSLLEDVDRSLDMYFRREIDHVNTCQECGTFAGYDPEFKQILCKGTFDGERCGESVRPASSEYDNYYIIEIVPENTVKLSHIIGGSKPFDENDHIANFTLKNKVKTFAALRKKYTEP